jgi:hypothetical protein
MSEKKEIAQAWNRLVRNTRTMEQNLLALVRHPDATEKHVMQAVELYRESWLTLCRVENDVRAKVGGAYPMSLKELK